MSLVIDMHVHPMLYKPTIRSGEELNFRKEQFGLDLMSPVSLDLVKQLQDFSGIDMNVLLPLDLTTTAGGCIVTNEEIAAVTAMMPDRLIGFASVDPHRPDAKEVLEHAFGELGLKGLKLNPAKQKFDPNEACMDEIYKTCIAYNKPIIFHSGMSWEPNTLMEAGRPVIFEPIAIKYPELRICLAHFGWPWIQETAALVLKYPNVYTDTSLLYMDSPKIFMKEVLTEQLGHLWIENNFADRVMFGSNNPRFRAGRMKEGIEELPWRTITKEKVLGKNALRFLGMEEV